MHSNRPGENPQGEAETTKGAKSTKRDVSDLSRRLQDGGARMAPPAEGPLIVAGKRDQPIKGTDGANGFILSETGKNLDEHPV